MKMKSKIISIILALTLVIVSLAVGISAFGATQTLLLDTQMSATIDGEDDLAVFIFTPSASGTYSFLSYSVPATEAYLSIREKDEETGEKKIINLAYSNSDPDYEANGHNSRQFCLTYHLEAGVKYYFSAGWYLSENRTTGTINVLLRCDGYDVDVDRIEAHCPVTLDAYSNGSWNTDEKGSSYFFYNISRIISNTTITLYYTDGTSVSSTGEETVGGYDITYSHNQAQEHWYPQGNENYTANTMTFKVLDKTASVDVQINSTARQSVTGKVVDMTGAPVGGAEIKISGAVITQTNNNGNFTFSNSPGAYFCTVSTDNSIDRDFTIVVSSLSSTDYSGTPIEVCTCDYVDDGVINAKDFALMMKTLEGEELEEQQQEFGSSINLTKGTYPALSLN